MNCPSFALRLIALATFLALTACATDDIAPAVPDRATDESFFTPREETLVLDADTNTDLVSFDVESGELVYRPGSPQLDSIAVGSIIVSGPAEGAPAGFLRRVTGVGTAGGEMTYATETANLPDAFSAYRWNMRGTSAVQFRDEEEPGVFSFLNPVDTTFAFDIPGSETKFELSLKFIYALDFISLIEFQPSLTGGQITDARLGVERFSVDSLVLEMAFVRSGEATTEETFSSEDVQAFFDNIFTVSLSPIPIGPGASPVYVTPSVQLDLSTMMEYSVALGQRAAIYNTGQPYRRVVALQPNGQYAYEAGGTTPAMQVDVDIFLDGSFAYASGLSIGLAVSPYSRSLFALGTRVTAAPKVTLSGHATAGIRAGEPVGVFNAQVDIDLAASAGVFLDADFFGFAPDAWDVERTLWENDFSLFGLSVDNSCGFFFNSVTTNVICNGDLTELYFTVNRSVQPDVDGSGTYSVYIDGELVGSGYEPDEEHVAILESAPAGIRRVRFLREDGGSDFFFCEADEMIVFPDCLGTDYCQGDRRIIDARTAYAYCAGEFAGRDWFLNNLYTLLPDGTAPRCYDDDPALCTSYGGYYGFDDLLDVGPDASPISRRGLCPEGFHVPSVAEWLELFGLSPATQPNEEGVYLIPGVLDPYRDETSWADLTPPAAPNGFRAIAAGWHTVSSNSVFSDLGTHAYFWTSDVTGADAGAGGETEAGGVTGAYAVILDGLNNTVELRPAVRSQEYNCRCVED